MRVCTRRTVAVALAAAVVAIGSASQADPSLRRPSYKNPVFNWNFPDPTVIHASDGRYYAYATQSRSMRIQVSSSLNLVSWSRPREALPEAPVWSQNQDVFWAPHVAERGGTYYLYYSAAPDETDIPGAICLAVATAATPRGPFTDVGRPLYCGDTGSDIDAAIFQDPKSGKWYAYWGSGGDIVVAPMARDLVSLKRPRAYPKTVLRGWSADPQRPFEHGIEGPWLLYRGGWYYLFYSGDRCCEYPPHYAPMVARSWKPTGPFTRYRTATDHPYAVVLRSNGRWAGPGHNSTVQDALGHHWFVYHAIDRSDPYMPDGGVRRVMLLDRIRFEDGWPWVGAGTPSTERLPGPVTTR